MIDPNEAPEGYVAVKAKHACAGCSFLDKRRDCTLNDFICYPSQRNDGENVIFIPREKAENPDADELAEAKAEIERWKAEAERWRGVAQGQPTGESDEVSKWRSACRERDELIAKLKAQLTAALESIARMR